MYEYGVGSMHCFTTMSRSVSTEKDQYHWSHFVTASNLRRFWPRSGPNILFLLNSWHFRKRCSIFQRPHIEYISITSWVTKWKLNDLILSLSASHQVSENSFLYYILLPIKKSTCTFLNASERYVYLVVINANLSGSSDPRRNHKSSSRQRAIDVFCNCVVGGAHSLPDPVTSPLTHVPYPIYQGTVPAIPSLCWTYNTYKGTVCNNVQQCAF